MPPSRISDTFARLRERGENALIVYLTVGFPDPEATLELAPALAEGGADIIELGVPFSDPLADGVTIQKASFHALNKGVTLAMCIDTVAKLRGAGLETPLILMGYYNPYWVYGLDRFAADAASAGVDGLIAADVPTEESGPLSAECQKQGLDLIPLLAPTSPDHRIEAACRDASGFVYCVSLTGVTGARQQISAGAESLVARVRSYTSLPVAVGFGISTREHVARVAAYADGAVVGSALLNVVESAPPGQAAQRARSFVQELSGRNAVEAAR